MYKVRSFVVLPLHYSLGCACANGAEIPPQGRNDKG
jgi:hypothetical protein